MRTFEPRHETAASPLAALYPHYTEAELIEAAAQLRRYFDLAWKVFVRLEREGKLNQLNLTVPKVNPTVNPLKLTDP